MNLTSLKTNFGRILLLSTALVISINTIAGGRSSERNFLSKSLLFTPVAPRLKTKALLLMSMDLLMGMDLLMSMVLLMSVDSCERTVSTIKHSPCYLNQHDCRRTL
jgi:hypothetical protein